MLEGHGPKRSWEDDDARQEARGDFPKSLAAAPSRSPQLALPVQPDRRFGHGKTTEDTWAFGSASSSAPSPRVTATRDSHLGVGYGD